MDRIKDANLYIWLGMDNLFSLNLKQLLISEVKPELEKVFSLRDIVGSDQYPSRMGLFVMDSKVHFFGGENLERQQGHFGDDYFNKKVFSFNLPDFTPDLSTRYPCHSGNKFRPIAVTISNKVYALSTIPFPFTVKKSFEVFEPEVGEWRTLPLPPIPDIWSVKSYCVFQNNLLIMTSIGDYIFYANPEKEKWEPFDKFEKSEICALLEYKDHIFVLNKDPLTLVAYELASFESSSKAEVVIDTDVSYSSFMELNISWASFNIIDDNYISLVFLSTQSIHVSLFQFIPNDVTYDTDAVLEAYQEFDIPGECYPDCFPFYSTFLLCTKAQETPTAVSQLDTNRDRYLYISLGYDNLFSLNFNDLCTGKDKDKDKLDLKVLHTNNRDRGADFPIGTGLFFSDSKLHFFGGETLERIKSESCLGHYAYVEMGLGNYARSKYKQQGHRLKEWGNKKVFSFNLFPDFTLINNSNQIPDHSSFKFRPLVFTISNKVYALSMRPLSSRFFDKVKLFEVYDLVAKKWRDLKEVLHPDLCKLIRNDALYIRSQFVFRNKLLLQTNRGGDYLFTPSGDSGKWDQVDGNKFPSIWAGVEYNDKFLLVLTKPQNELVAYESASFGEKNSTPPTKLYIYNNVIDFSAISEGASLQVVDHNLINLVFVDSFDKNIHVTVLKVEIPLRHAVVEVYRIFDLPKEFHEFYLGLNSTFLWQSDVIQQDDTKANDPREKKRRECIKKQNKRRGEKKRIKHMIWNGKYFCKLYHFKKVYQKNQKKGEKKRIKHMTLNEGGVMGHMILRKCTKKIKKGEKKRIKHMILNEGGVMGP